VEDLSSISRFDYWREIYCFMVCTCIQRRNDGVAAASSDGGPTGGRGPPTVLFYFKSEGGALT